MINLLKGDDEKSKYKVCAYHYTLYSMNKYDIILMPYNYVLNPDIRDKVGLVLEKKVIIFDEAHNLERNFDHSCSFQLSLNDIKFTE